jgi:hypothetical protein
VTSPPDTFKLGHSTPKLDDSRNFLKSIVGKFQDLIGQKAKTICDTNPDGKAKTGVMIVPHDSVRQLHEEYVCYRKSQNYDPASIAGYDTFNKAFVTLEKEDHIRLMGCKGSFPTCDICNNCNDLLRNANKRNRTADLEAIMDFKRAHLAQQEVERQHMEFVKNECRELIEGQPKGLYMCPDGMTERRTDLPREHSDTERHGKETRYFTNRVIGVDVVCGPNVVTKMLFHLDKLAVGGANLMVEIIRQVIVEVGKLLPVKQRIPKKMYWQMDNCGENKNKGIFFKLFISDSQDMFNSIKTI